MSEKNQWFKTAETKPPLEDHVLCDARYCTWVGYLSVDGRWYDQGGAITRQPEHWQKLPVLQSEQEQCGEEGV